MNEKLFEEDLSISYLRAIAAQAQVTFELNHRDEDSKDVDLKQQTVNDSGEPFNVEFSVQLKATYTLDDETSDSIKYPLRVKNYNDLCQKGCTDIILCLLVLPKDPSEWVNQTPNDLILKRCMYWVSLKGKSPSSNTTTVTIDIPKKNIMSVETLKQMIHKIANEGGL